MKYFRLSKITVFLALFIIISATFMRQLWEFLQRYAGSSGMKAILCFVMVAPSIAFLIYVIKGRVHPIKTAAIIFLVVIGLILAWRVKYPVEKIHILEYGALGWLAVRDLMKVKIKSTAIILAGVFCIVVGYIDEALQAILPYRVYDIRDIVFNSLGGIWGIVLYLLAQPMPKSNKRNCGMRDV